VTCCWVTNSFSFNFLRNLYNLFLSGCTNLHSHQQCMRVSFTPSPTLVICLSDNRHSNRCEMIYLVLVCISLMTGDVSTSSYSCWPSVLSSEKGLFRSFAHFWNECFGMTSLYILDINLLPDTRFANVNVFLIHRLPLPVSFSIYNFSFLAVAFSA